MSSEESDPPKDSDPPHSSTGNLHHEAKLVRSASDNCNLAHCWAKDHQSITSKSSVESKMSSVEGRYISGSISLQEIASIVSNAISHVCIDNPNSPPSEAKSQPAFATPSASCCKQTDIHIPSTVFEDKASAKDELNQKASMTCRGSNHSDKNTVDGQQDFFFWSQAEAEEKQIEQIGASACGATAILNVMVRERLHLQTLYFQMIKIIHKVFVSKIFNV